MKKEIGTPNKLLLGKIVISKLTNTALIRKKRITIPDYTYPTTLTGFHNVGG